MSARGSAGWLIFPGFRGVGIDVWRRQEAIDNGELPGVTSTELAELSKARRRIAELEAELAIQSPCRGFAEGGGAPKSPVRGHQTLAAEGFSVDLCCRVLDVSVSGYYAWRSRPPRDTPTASDLVNRQFDREARDLLWVTDTEHPTRTQVEPSAGVRPASLAAAPRAYRRGRPSRLLLPVRCDPFDDDALPGSMPRLRTGLRPPAAP
ncbi:hypothetical protein [Mangrovihabitans endophyticus]|uniref:Transposase n=1 Tax=Mangrovihabitans endophyticus TaxID=1751298 RepID=A0A8J3BWJ9_9ACTN|nr:hypothetical protein [Mangrovihabitans endophyticus]GGK72527.1 hypothetical protein GCM10012284_02910 [Mangrovihabitans endophyticus]